CMVFLLMGGAYLRSRIKQAGKWDQETIVSFFLCQYCSGEYLLGNGYHGRWQHANYAGVAQRWLLVRSEQASHREQQTLAKNLL
ncbi:hypothetical protein, partial [Aeromonas caviae]|uniref:hypothetical protein n=1 Tax=Aeromonas caviae TaxID=648 RepID=UPI0025B69D45